MIQALFAGQWPAAVLFDLDGTLVDSVPDIAQAVDQTLVARGFSAVGEAEVRRWVGNGARKLVQRALAFTHGVDEGDVPESELESAHQQFRGFYQACCADRTRFYAGVKDTLSQLRGAGVALGCVTNKPLMFTEVLLDHLGIRSWFGVILGGECLAQKKPHPLPLLTAAERLGVPVARCLMVGDSANDILAARAAGMKSVCVTYGYHQGVDVYTLGADRVIARFGDLLAP